MNEYKYKAFTVALTVSISAIVAITLKQMNYDYFLLCFFMLVAAGSAVILSQDAIKKQWARWGYRHLRIEHDLRAGEDREPYTARNGQYIEDKFYGVAIRHKKRIEDLRAEIVSIDPPIPGVQLPFDLGPCGISPSPRYEPTFYEHHFLAIHKQRIDHAQVSSELIGPGDTRTSIPNANYQIVISAKRNWFDKARATVSLNAITYRDIY